MSIWFGVSLESFCKKNLFVLYLFGNSRTITLPEFLKPTKIWMDTCIQTDNPYLTITGQYKYLPTKYGLVFDEEGCTIMAKASSKTKYYPWVYRVESMTQEFFDTSRYPQDLPTDCIGYTSGFGDEIKVVARMYEEVSVSAVPGSSKRIQHLISLGFKYPEVDEIKYDSVFTIDRGKSIYDQIVSNIMDRDPEAENFKLLQSYT